MESVKGIWNIWKILLWKSSHEVLEEKGKAFLGNIIG